MSEFVMNRKKLAQIKSDIGLWADARDEVLFAYLHGSALDGNAALPRDVDVAVYLAPEVEALHAARSDEQWALAIPMEMEVHKILRAPVDVQILNRAPLPFRFRVVTSGTVLADKDPDKRAEFEYLARVEYFDFMPRRYEYLREAAV